MFRPRRLRLWRILAWSSAALAALVCATVVVCAIIQGPVTVYRVVTRLDTTIDDHRIDPSRPLEPSSAPYRFRPDPQPAVARLALDRLGAIELTPFLEASDTIAFLIVKDDRLLYERYFQGRKASDISQVFSTAKSVLSALIGLAVSDGVLGPVETPVSRYVPEMAQAGFDEIRLVDLLQMRSRIAYVENSNPFGEHVRFNFTPHLEHDILQLHLKPRLEDHFVYKSGDNALLGLALSRALKGETITGFTQRALWDPLGMEFRGLWSLDHEGGLEKTWCCLSAAARDLAKIGALYRDGGLWRGRRLLPESWVRASTREGAYASAEWTPGAYTTGFWNYGYQWWLIDQARGDFMSRGKDGQYIYVDPGSGVVIVRLGYSHGAPGGRKLATTDWVALFQAIAGRSGAL